MSTISARVGASLTINESFSSAEMPLASSPSVRHAAANLSKSLGASTTPSATKCYNAAPTGSASLDLTSLTDTLGASLDLTGLKVLALIVANPSGNAADVVIADGSSNPYSLNGGDDLTIPPGATACLYFAEQLDDVGAAAKAIDITAGVGESYSLSLVAG